MFGGGTLGTVKSDAVDIFNVTSGEWTTATLSLARDDLAAAAAGDFVLFGGGDDTDSASSDVVDIFNIRTKEWTTGNKILKNKSSLHTSNSKKSKNRTHCNCNR